MSDPAPRLGVIPAARNAFAAQVPAMQTSVQRTVAHRHKDPDVEPSREAQSPRNSMLENNGEFVRNSSYSSSGGDHQFFLEEFGSHNLFKSYNNPGVISKKSTMHGMETKLILPQRTSTKSLVSVGNGKLAASSGSEGSLSVRVSLNKKQLPGKSQEEEDKLTYLSEFMSSSSSASKQATDEWNIQIWWSAKFTAGQLHSMIRCDDKIDAVDFTPVDGLSFLDEVETARGEQRLTDTGRPCCSHPGCTKQVQMKGKCIAHGGVKECNQPGCKGVARFRGRCTEHGGRRTCSLEKCDKLALSGGKCLEHGGGGGKKCSVPNCNTRPQRKGLCAAHGGYMVCKTEGCERRAATKGLCSHHNVVAKCKTEGCEKAGSNRGYCYKHAVESGAIKVSRKAKCKVDDCVKIQLRQGYCSRHAKERGLTVGRTCKAEGCNKVAQAGGCCVTHGGGTRCKIPDCTKSIVTKGLCSVHGGRKTCKVEGCEKWGLSAGDMKGYCVQHGGGSRCKHPGCGKSAQYKGLCCTHGGRLKCEARGCNKTVRVKGYCATHQVDKTNCDDDNLSSA